MTHEGSNRPPAQISGARGGLDGIIAGHTSLSTVGVSGVGLTYLGYAIEDLAEKATFEEVAFLLLFGHLPSDFELSKFDKKLRIYF